MRNRVPLFPAMQPDLWLPSQVRGRLQLLLPDLLLLPLLLAVGSQIFRFS